MKNYKIWTDGSCYPNPGPGGYGFIIRPAVGQTIKGSGGILSTTNNRAEMTAIIKALEVLKEPAKIMLIIDSQYVGYGIIKWRFNWLKQGWKNLNGDLWETLHELCERHKVTVKFVRGHSTCSENNECDRLAAVARKRITIV